MDGPVAVAVGSFGWCRIFLGMRPGRVPVGRVLEDDDKDDDDTLFHQRRHRHRWQRGNSLGVLLFFVRQQHQQPEQRGTLLARSSPTDPVDVVRR